MSDVMEKGEHYRILKDAGLPVPIYGVFDSDSIKDAAKKTILRKCVNRILTEGSGLIGVRTEPKTSRSSLGGYPHYMPLRSFEEVVDAIKKNERSLPKRQWWYLVNEAFTDYAWSAVLRLTQEGVLPGHWALDGEVNLTDNLPLRPALDSAEKITRARDWKGRDAAQIRRLILQSDLLEEWIEIRQMGVFPAL